MKTDKLPIYQNGLTLSPSEEQMLVEKAWSQSKKIAKILKNRIGFGYTYQEMRVCLEGLFGEDNVNQDSVKRAMSTMTGAKGAPDKMKDKYGRWPLIKLTEKRLNPETQVHIHVYAWNPMYGKPPSNEELVSRHAGNQMNFHEDLFNSVKP